MRNNKYFYISTPHLKHLYFLSLFVISTIRNYVKERVWKLSNLSISFFNLYIFVIADSLSFIPNIIIKKRTENNKTNIIQPLKEENNEIELLYNPRDDEEIIKMQNKGYKKIILLSFLDYIAQISIVISILIINGYRFDIHEINLNSLLIFNILFIIVLSKLMLDTPFYRHHYFSTILITLILCFLVVLDAIQLTKNHNKVLIRIFDTFVLDGWISVIRIGLLLLKLTQFPGYNFVF